MKRNLLYLFALICSMGVFTACSSDDDNNIVDNGEGLTIENSVVGTFGGKLNITMNGDDLTPNGIDQKVYITKTGENQVSLLLKNFSFGVFNIGDIEVDPCMVTKDKKTFSFSGKKTLSFPAAPSLGECPVTVDGTVVDGNIAVTIGVDVTKLSQKVVVTFGGNKMENDELLFNFDEWETIKSTSVDSKEQYDLPKGEYGASNPGLVTINEMVSQVGMSFDYPVISVTGRTGQGKAAQIKTIHTAIIIPGEDGEDMDFNAALGGMIPYNTSGSLFTGSFWNDFGQMISNPLNCTKFGIPVKGKPETFSGYYKYVPSADYYDEANKKVADKVDACAIYAVVYEEFMIKDSEEKEVIGWLNGDWKNQKSEDVNLADRYIGASSRVVMKAALSNGSAKADWTSFSIPFEMMSGKTYDPSKKYYLAIVCASSAEGDYYRGGDGSVLTVDDFKVTVKF